MMLNMDRTQCDRLQFGSKAANDPGMAPSVFGCPDRAASYHEVTDPSFGRFQPAPPPRPPAPLVVNVSGPSAAFFGVDHVAPAEPVSPPPRIPDSVLPPSRGMVTR